MNLPEGTEPSRPQRHFDGTRRAFLTTATSIGVGAVVAACSQDYAPPRPSSTVSSVRDRPPEAARNSVVVVGAGLAGLTTALDLRAAGWDVTVLDGHDIPALLDAARAVTDKPHMLLCYTDPVR
jgi:NADPH-dependent 2,4-dienoyl-CoA reductase/sulfur reductase-like enzyme